LKERLSRLRDVSDFVVVKWVGGWRGVPLVLLIRDLRRDAAFDAADGPAGAGAADRHRARLVLKRRVERAPDLEGVGAEVDELQAVVGGRDRNQMLVCAHGVDALGEGERAERVALAQVPVAHRLVPRARGDDGRVDRRDRDEAGRAHGRVVAGKRGGGGGRGEVHDVDLLVCARAEGEGAVLGRGSVVVVLVAGGATHV